MVHYVFTGVFEGVSDDFCVCDIARRAHQRRQETGTNACSRTCRLCGAAAAHPEDIYHLAISCPHLAKPRAAIHASLPSLAGYLLQSVRDSYTRRGKILEAFSGEELAALEAFISGAPLPVPEQSFITYRLLLAAPWPSSLARSHNYQESALAASSTSP